MEFNTRKIIVFISIIVLSTICLQAYWNYKNYVANKERLTNEVQIAYDNSLETYFDETSKETFISLFSSDSTVQINDFIDKMKTESFFKKASNKKEFPDSLLNSSTKLSVAVKEIEKDSAKAQNRFLETKSIIRSIDIQRNPSITVLKGKKAFDSIGGLEHFPSKITISLTNDSIRYAMLDSIFKIELERKNIVLPDYNFDHFKKDSLLYSYPQNKKKSEVKVVPNSVYLKPNETITLNYNYPKELLIKRMSSELILSFLFSTGVIGCLYFLLYIIKKQKKTDEIKNDFINNITHEFKTPITTITSALEGMSKFNPENDITKNQKYISMSFDQLHKLEKMVEKILETATLNTNQLYLNKENILLIPFIKSILEKHQETTAKPILFTTEKDYLTVYGDSFYLENVISNLIDNAIKYGGDTITINCFCLNKQIVIDVMDNGNPIPKSEEKIVFEKFYRIPKGNLHDVKGYGIGLYYAKEIIEKHNGTLELLRTNETIFRITLPDEH